MSDQSIVPTNDSQQILDAAHHLINLGYRAIPTVKNEKRPAVPWKKFQKTRPKISHWEKWIKDFPGCGIGIVTNGLVIVDVDLHRDEDGNRTKHNVFVDQPIVKELMEKSPVVCTRSGGRQIYFRQNLSRKLKNSASLLAPDVDIRADGGFAVVPPTVAAGGQYNWVGHFINSPPGDLPELPDAILDRLAGEKSSTKAKSFEEMSQPLDDETPLIVGSRNQTLHKLTSKARGRGLEGRELKAVMVMHNKRCVDAAGNPDPLSVEELKIIYGSVMGYPTNKQKSAITKSGEPVQEESDEKEQPEMFTVQTNGRKLRELEADCWRVLLGEEVYNSAGSLVYLIKDSSGVRVRRFTKHSLWLKLGRCAEWVTSAAKGVAHSTPPMMICQGMVDNPHPAVKVLESIATAPFYTSAGVLIQQEGYHQKSRTYLSLGEELAGLKIPKKPTPQQIAEAYLLLADDLLGDFPFDELSDMAHVFAGMLAPFMREMITGPIPIHMIEAPTPGSGKTLLAGLIGRIITGRAPAMMTMPRSGDEQQKTITAILMNNPQITVIDNVASGVWSSQFASALTADEYSGRILGKSESCNVTVKTLWVFSGNNPAMSEEIARRCIRIRLVPATDKPFLRGGFRHHDINRWVAGHRLQLVGALLTLIQAWVVAGRPTSDHILGSFQSWAEQMGAILAAPGIAGFLENQEAFIEAADDETADWTAFVSAWHEKFGPQHVTAAQLFSLAELEELVQFALDAKTSRGQKTKFGRHLAKLRDKVVDGFKISVENRGGKNPNRYYLTQQRTPEVLPEP